MFYRSICVYWVKTVQNPHYLLQLRIYQKHDLDSAYRSNPERLKVELNLSAMPSKFVILDSPQHDMRHLSTQMSNCYSIDRFLPKQKLEVFLLFGCPLETHQDLVCFSIHSFKGDPSWCNVKRIISGSLYSFPLSCSIKLTTKIRFFHLYPSFRQEYFPTVFGWCIS